MAERMMMRKQVTKYKYKKLTTFLKTILLATLTFKAEREAAFLFPLITAGHESTLNLIYQMSLFHTQEALLSPSS